MLLLTPLLDQSTIDRAVRALYDSVDYIVNEKNNPALYTDSQLCTLLNGYCHELGLSLRFVTDNDDILVMGDDLGCDVFYFSLLVATFDFFYPGNLKNLKE